MLQQMGSERGPATKIDRGVKIYATCLPATSSRSLSFYHHSLYGIFASECNSLCTLDLRSKLVTCSDVAISC